MKERKMGGEEISVWKETGVFSLFFLGTWQPFSLNIYPESLGFFFALHNCTTAQKCILVHKV